MLKNKYLIISSWSPPDIGGPQSLYNLFSKFSKASFEILTIYYTDLKRKTGSWLPCRYNFIDHQPIIDASEKHIQITDQAKKMRIRVLSEWVVRNCKTLAQRIAPVKNAYLGYQFFLKLYKFFISGRRIISRSQPNVLIGISDNGPALLATYWLSRKLHKSAVYILFDLYHGNFLEFPGRWFAKHFEKRMFEGAKKIVVTNEATQHYYQERYPHIRDHFIVIHNSVCPEKYEGHRTPYVPTAPFTIVFTGHVYWAQENAVFNLIAAMRELVDLPVKLELYIPNPYPKLIRAVQDFPSIVLTSAPPEEMPRVQGRATLLFLPLAWNTKAPDIIATATPGKFTDYLASGRPMLIHAPSYAFVSMYAREHELGIVVDENSPAQLAQAIRKFLQHPQIGKTYVANALRVFHENHDAGWNEKKLTKFLEMVQ